LVTKDELMTIAWPRLFVHDSNLKVNMANLRRSLGDTQKEPIYVATVYGRGYQFVAPVAIEVLADTQRIDERESTEASALLATREIVGRDEDIARMVAELRKRQFTCFYRYSDGSAPELNLPGLTERNDPQGEEQRRT
jgi:DNA-binding winged helix-turn-helix (wHTH) protein